MPRFNFALFLATFLLAGAAQAQAVDVQEAWVRGTVPGQTATGAFMKLTARQDLRLVGVVSAAADIAEVHEMKMVGDVMRMRAAPVIELPAGQTVELKPGGYHVMLMDLKAPLKVPARVPLTLLFKDAKGVESRVDVQVPVRAAAPASGMKH